MTHSQKREPEGRISTRHAFEKRIRIRLRRSGQELTTEGWTRNLSEGGVNAFVAQSLNKGELVTLEIPLQDETTHSIPAQVARTMGTEYGFQFTALSGEQRSQILIILKRQPVIYEE